MSLPVALVGAGRWGRNLLTALRRLPEFELVAICEPRPFDCDLPRYDTLSALLEAEQVAAVVVATPPDTHAELAFRGLASGKHVFVEKPLCDTVADADALVEAQRRFGARLMVGHLLMYHPAFRRLARRAARQGGRRVIRATRWSEAGGVARCPWWTLAPHDIALSIRLAGMPTAVRVGRNQGELTAELEFEGGTTARFSLSTVAPRKIRRFSVQSDDDVLLFDDLAQHRLVSVHGRWRRPIAVPTTAPLEAELRHFATCLRTGAEFESDVFAGRQVVEVLAAGQRSLERQGRWQSFGAAAVAGCM